jgi:hypothetical protein
MKFSFKEWEIHKRNLCKRKCFYCKQEDEEFEFKSKQAKKLINLAWDDRYGQDNR